MMGSVGQPLSSSSCMLSRLSPRRARRSLANMPRMESRSAISILSSSRSPTRVPDTSSSSAPGLVILTPSNKDNYRPSAFTLLTS